jgi:NEDD8-activating enzyme E1
VELLKHLVRDENEILVVDSDRISLSNLHRLYMFAAEDRGRLKAERAAELIREKYGKKVDCLVARFQDLPLDVVNQHDVLLCALDNIEGRMDMNYVFKRSTCKLLIDCGINGYKAHAKAVFKGASCLYCIRDLYVNESEMNICSLPSAGSSITLANRRRAIRSLIEDEKMQDGDRDTRIRNIVERFNEVADMDLRTTSFEVEGEYDRITPNVCFINSICAGMVYAMLKKFESGLSYDFVFYTGEERVLFASLRLRKNDDCILCNAEEEAPN